MVIAKNGGVQDLTFTDFNTLTGVDPRSVNSSSEAAMDSPPNLRLNLVNTFGADTNVYICALDTSNRVIILQPNGQWLYPTATNPSVPQPITDNIAIAVSAGATTSLTLPDFFISGRIYFAQGELKFFTLQTGNGGVTLVRPLDKTVHACGLHCVLSHTDAAVVVLFYFVCLQVSPDPQNPSDSSAELQWGFAEMTYTPTGGLFADISFVDFVGMSMGMQLTTTDGSGTQVVKGTEKNAVAAVCGQLAAKTEANGPWSEIHSQAHTHSARSAVGHAEHS